MPLSAIFAIHLGRCTSGTYYHLKPNRASRGHAHILCVEAGEHMTLCYVRNSSRLISAKGRESCCAGAAAYDGVSGMDLSQMIGTESQCKQ